MAQPQQQQRRPSLADVAAAAGVSKGAVSKVIRNAYGVSDAMRLRVEATIGELGYRPRTAARSMRGASFTLGVEIPQLGNDFVTQVLNGAANELVGSGYQLIIAPGLGEMRGTPVLNALMDRQVDGIIAVSPDVAPDWLEKLGEQVPLVLLGRHDKSENYDTITSDDTAGALLVMEHLFALGHTDIAHVTVGVAPEVPAGLLPHTLRRNAYEDSMAAHAFTPRVEVCGPSADEAYHSARELLLASEPPTAIFASNDTIAVGVLRARWELGLSADELSVASYDNIDIATHPAFSLTTVDHFGVDLGVMAVNLLMQRIRGERTEAEHHLLPPELRVRESTKPARRTASAGARSSVRS